MDFGSVRQENQRQTRCKDQDELCGCSGAGHKVRCFEKRQCSQVIHTGDQVTTLIRTMKRNIVLFIELAMLRKKQGGQSKQPVSNPRLSDKELIHCYFVALGVSLFPAIRL